MKSTKSWFTMKAGNTAEISIFDEIDSSWGIGPQQFKTELDKVKGASTIKLLLNSPGGSVFDGLAIANMLSVYRDKLDIEVLGLAASIASIIALSGRSLTMAKGSYFMIHNPLTIMMGGAEDLRKTADLLDKMKTDFIRTYRDRCHKPAKEISDMMNAETWLDADEAVAQGFATDVVDYGEIAAKASAFDLSRFDHAPRFAAKGRARSSSSWRSPAERIAALERDDQDARLEADAQWISSRMAPGERIAFLDEIAAR